MNYIGMDIHKQFTYAVVKDKDGNELDSGKFDNSLENFTQFLEPYCPEETKIVMESTSVWEHIYDLLESLNYIAILANPMKTKAIAYARIKTDKIDASILADLLRANLVASNYIPPKEVRELREIMRQRKTIVRGKTQIKNKIHAILTRKGIKLPYKTLCQSSFQWILEETNNFTIKSTLISYINLLEQYEFEVKKLLEKIQEIIYDNKQAQLLMTIPGIGPVFAIEVLSEIGEIGRFESGEKLCSYAGLVPSIKQSGSTLKFGRLIKKANTTIKCALIEASWVAVRTKENNPLKEHYMRLAKKKGKQKAICATARKMCCIIYAMLSKNQTFMFL